MKQLKKLIIPSIILLVLVIVLVVIAIAKPKGSKTEEARENFSVITISNSDLASFELLNANNDIIRVNITHSDVTDIYDYQGYDAEEGVTYNQSSLQTFVGILSDFNAKMEIVNPAPLSEYGLENPTYKITLTQNDGTVYHVNLGNKTYDNSGCYFSVDEIDGVYVTSVVKLAYCDYSAINFLESYPINIDYSDISTVEFTRNSILYPSENCSIQATCTLVDTGDATYQVFSPYSIQASPYFENLVDDFIHLTISQFVELTDEEKETYRIDEPAYIFKFNLNSGEYFEIRLTEAYEDTFYGTCTGLDYYFMANKMQLDDLSTPVLDLLSSYVSYLSVSDITKITCTYGDSSYILDLDVPNGSAISAENATCNLNLRNAKVFNSDGRSYAAVLFESLACIDIAGIEIDATPEYNPEVSLLINTRDYINKNIEFVPRDADSYYVFINGEYSYFYVYSREIFRNSGQNTYDYGFVAAFELAERAIDGQLQGVYDIPEDEA